MTEDGKDSEQKSFFCDLCSKEVAWSALVNVHIKAIQKAVRDGFNPFETPGVTMPDPETLFPGHSDLSPEEMYDIWRERTMIDSVLDHWYLCHNCARALKQPIPEGPAFKSKASTEAILQRAPRQPQLQMPADPKADKETKTPAESKADLVATVLFVLAASWVGSMAVFAIKSHDMLLLVTILGAICMGAGIMYFGFITFSLPQFRQDEDTSPDAASAKPSPEPTLDYQSALPTTRRDRRTASTRSEEQSGDYLHRLLGGSRATIKGDDKETE